MPQQRAVPQTSQFYSQHTPTVPSGNRGTGCLANIGIVPAICQRAASCIDALTVIGPHHFAASRKSLACLPFVVYGGVILASLPGGPENSVNWQLAQEISKWLCHTTLDKETPSSTGPAQGFRGFCTTLEVHLEAPRSLKAQVVQPTSNARWNEILRTLARIIRNPKRKRGRHAVFLAYASGYDARCFGQDSRNAHLSNGLQRQTSTS